MSSSAPGRTSRAREASSVPGRTSSRPTPTTSARSRRSDGRGSRRWTRSPARRSRSSPCQASATSAVAAIGRPQPSGNSSATGARSHAGASRQEAGSSATGIGAPGSRHCWILPRGVSMFSNTGAEARLTTFSSTPADRRRSSSAAVDPGPSTPTTAAVRSPNRARVRPPYVTPPPSRQPRSSSAARSRAAEPTTTTSGTVQPDPVKAAVRCIVGRVVRPPYWATGRQRDGDLNRAFLRAPRGRR